MRREDREIVAVLVLDPIADKAQGVGRDGDTRVEQQHEVAGGGLDALLARGEAAGALLVEDAQRQRRSEPREHVPCLRVGDHDDDLGPLESGALDRGRGGVDRATDPLRLFEDGDDDRKRGHRDGHRSLLQR